MSYTAPEALVVDFGLVTDSGYNPTPLGLNFPGAARAVSLSGHASFSLLAEAALSRPPRLTGSAELTLTAENTAVQYYWLDPANVDFFGDGSSYIPPAGNGTNFDTDVIPAEPEQNTVDGVFAALQGFATGKHTILGDCAASLAAVTASAVSYTGSKYRPSRLVPSWEYINGVVSFDLADVPLIGQADDSRQILMGLLQLWEQHYLTMPFPSERVYIRYEPKNVMPPSKGENFVWVSASVVVSPGSEEVVDEH